MVIRAIENNFIGHWSHGYDLKKKKIKLPNRTGFFLYYLYEQNV